jgi:uncharacterized protein (DUF302 family)
MKLIKGLFRIFSFIVVIGGTITFFRFDGIKKIDQILQLNENALTEYIKMFDTVLTTGDAAIAMVRRVKVETGLSNNDVARALNNLAIKKGLKSVNIVALSDEIEERTSKKRKMIKIFSFYDPVIVGELVDYSTAFGAFLPCRIILTEDENGDKWLHTIAMEIFIEGSNKVDSLMLEKFNKLRENIYNIMDEAVVRKY